MSNTDAMSIRVGDYRVLVDYEAEKDRMKVVAVGHRRNIYDMDV